jgi:hypothetical protein
MDTTRNTSVAYRRRAAVVAAGTAVTAMLLTLTACQKGDTTGQTQTSTSASTTTSTTTSTKATSSKSAPAKADYGQTAVGIIDAISQSDFTAATLDFDSHMQQTLPPSELSANWASYQQQYGTYKSHGQPQQVHKGNLTVVDIPLQMQKTAGLFRVSFRDKDGKVAALSFEKAGTPVP